jgi:hypothetical protein
MGTMLCIALAPHTIHNIVPIQILLHHLIHSVDIVLPVTVYGNRYIAGVLRLHETSENGILMSTVPALGYADKVLVLSSTTI